MKKGSIVTFYSYKGGVGRTFALANVGAALASWGYRVLCIDWDLDAPGLWQYFGAKKTDLGLVELITAVKDSETPNWRDYTTWVELANGTQLEALFAGKQDEGFIDRAQQLEWAQLYEEANLAEYLEEWRTQWKESYDFTLIDSRTGVTDIGALCTAHLPDFLVAVFTTNQQSLDGCIQVVSRAQKVRNDLPFDRSPLLTLPVPSRMDEREEYELVQQWRKRFAERSRQFYVSWAQVDIDPVELITRTTIPYVPYWSFGERLPIVEEKTRGTDSIGFYLETVAALIAHRLGDTKLLVESSENYIDVAERAGQRREGFTYDVFLDSTPDLAEKTCKLREDLREHGYRVFCPHASPQDQPDSAKKLELTLDQSQHAVFLLGREFSSQVDSELRRFARQTLEEGGSSRQVLPVLFSSALSSTLPSLISQTVIHMDEDTSIQILTNYILGMINEKAYARERRHSTELELALSKADSEDPLVREAVVDIIAESSALEALNKLTELMEDPEDIVSEKAREGLLELVSRNPDLFPYKVPTETMLSIIMESAGNPLEKKALDIFSRVFSRDPRLISRNFDPTHLSTMKDKLLRGTPQERAMVATIIGIIGQTSGLKHLIDLLSDPESDVRFSAVGALGKIESPEAVPWLLPYLRRCEFNSSMQIQLTEALLRIGSNQAIIGLMGADFPSHWIGWDLMRNTFNNNTEFAARLLVQLTDETAYIRESAAQALGRIGSERAIEDLLDRLEDTNADVRRAVVQALGQIGGEQAVEGLLDRLEDTNADVRWAAVQALGQIGGEQAVADLLDRLEDTEVDIRRAAVQVLGQMGSELAIDGLWMQLENQPSLIRCEIALILGRIGDEEAIRGLLKQLRDNHALVRKTAVEALGRIGREWVESETYTGMHIHATRGLVDRLEDTNRDVRLAAVQALGRIGTKRAVDGLLMQLENQPSLIRREIALILGGIGGEEAIRGLLTQLRDNNARVREAAIKALGRIDSKQMIQEILKLAEDERPYARQAAIQVLGQIGDDSVVEDLLMQLNDVNRDVRKAAVQALSQIQVAPGLIVGDLVPRLGDEYKDVRVATAEALGKMGDARAVEGLLDRLGDSHPDVRRAAARALGEIGGERAINGLRQQLGDFNADVRRETIEALEESDAIIPNWILPMLKDPDRAVRTTAIRTLVSEFGDRKMLQLISLGLDASAPWIDPKNPITWEDLMTVESELGIPVKEAQDAYERLNERLKGNLDLVWQDKPRNSDTD